MAFRPCLRPGLLLLRRDAGHLQLGTSPGVVVRDEPGLLALLRRFDGTADLTRLRRHADDVGFAGDVEAVATDLRVAGLVLAGLPRPARPTTSVLLDHDHATTPLAECVEALLLESGHRIVRRGAPADLTVVLSAGEPPRALFRAAQEARDDHLRVVVEDERVRIGPLVRPGLTPCIHCHDQHRTDWDRGWPALLTQLGSPGTLVVPPALPVATVHAAALRVLAEVDAYARGQDAGASRCVVVGPGPFDADTWPIGFHPACGCELLLVA
ncbi:hypothetical protein [Aeromicrobium massiliense]|uniref:hypothetical protein n=1 Tax=Aeromicrobium massiliense TaxID=1464554 RepID=UPI00031E6253|nr:hypothetical protein [Aeromicrobium massiliense]